MLDGMADRMEGEAPGVREELGDSVARLEGTVQSCCAVGPQEVLTAEVQTFLALSRNIANVTGVLDGEI